MEELELDYNVDVHKRVRGLAPEELKKTHPLGKPPQLIRPDGRVIIESSTILKYLIDTYDTKNQFKGDGGKNDSLRDQELSDMINSNMTQHFAIGLLLKALASESPFFIRPLTAGIGKAVRSAYLDAQFHLYWSYCCTLLEGQDYLMGSSPGRPDFMLSFVYDWCEGQKLVDVDKYPNMKDWRIRCRARPAWQRCLEKGRAGYDLTKLGG